VQAERRDQERLDDLRVTMIDTPRILVDLAIATSTLRSGSAGFTTFWLAPQRIKQASCRARTTW
jgi:hypothetical protein